MFTEEYEKLSRGDRNLFSEAINRLLYECYIIRRDYDRKSRMFKTDATYLFIERHYSLIEEYLSYIDIDISKSDDEGVIFITSAIEKNHLRMDSVTTVLVYALRSYYEGQIAKNPEEGEVLMSYAALNTLLQETGLSNLTKRMSSQTIAASLRQLDSYNVVTRVTNTYGDPSYSFFILPTIRYVISAEKMNALYSFLTKPQEEEDTPFINSYNAQSSVSKETEVSSDEGGYQKDPNHPNDYLVKEENQ